VRTGVVIGDRGFDVAVVERAAAGECSHAVLLERLAAPLPKPVDMVALLESGDGRMDALRSGVGRIAKVVTSGLGTDLQTEQFAIPTPGSGKILCVGRNFLEHIRESNHEVPGFPVIFTRFEDTLVAHGEPLVLPKNSGELDWEGELAVVIGKHCRHLSVDEAFGVIAGYSIINEGSVRDYQRKTVQWTAGKNFPGSGSYGPYLVTADEIPDPQVLDLETTINGETVQSVNTDKMMFSVAAVIAYITEWTELAPGDVIATGTPSGIGSRRDPPWYMKVGDVCEVTIEKVGKISNTVVAE
jgi:2-keto-4-pentenoate hydratase/2-oxohepta-3-ene-1,7-dioic acid hydratase in catechol pathway